MNALDTAESVRKHAKYAVDGTTRYLLLKYAALIPEHAALQAKHAALLEAVNRPVTEDELAEATITYMRAGPKNGDGVNTRQLRAALEAHMAALRDEVGK